tara:strand:+ start:326 stop:2170 length:1845 start_codon:yes stop_codon:yes gene_type:complete
MSTTFRKRPGTRGVDLRRYASRGLQTFGPDVLTEEDYFKIGGPEASEFFKEYKDDPLVTDLLNRYQFAEYDPEYSDFSYVVDYEDPAFKEGPITDFNTSAIRLVQRPELVDLPIQSLNDLKKQLELAKEGKGFGAPDLRDDPKPEEEQRLENFKAQARKDFVNLKDFLGEEVSEEERELAFKANIEEVDYGDFTPIGGRKSLEFEPIRDVGSGYVAPIFDEDFLPRERFQSRFNPIDSDRDLEYTPLEELLTPEPDPPIVIDPPILRSQGGLVGLPIITRKAGGNGGGNSSGNGSNGQTEEQKERSEMEDQDYREDDTEAPARGEDEGPPETDEDKIQEQLAAIAEEIEKQEEEKKQAERDEFQEEFNFPKVEQEITDPTSFVPDPDPTPQTLQDQIAEQIAKEQDIEKTEVDPITVQNVVDAMRDITEKGLTVDVGVDFQVDPDDPTGKPESSTLSFSGPDAADYAISQIAEAFGAGLDLAEDFGKGMYAVTPTALLTSGLFGDPKDKYSVGARAMEGFGFDVPFPNALDNIKSALGFSQAETIKGQSPDPTSITGQDLEAINKSELDKLSFQDRNQIETKAEDLSKVANISYNQALAVALDDYFGMGSNFES